MDIFECENLILIEFLVDKICFERKTKKELATIDGETWVSFQFLDNVPISICEEDFVPKCPADVAFVKRGKSCLFSLGPEQVKTAMDQFNVYVEVYKNVTSDKVSIGGALISVAESFLDLINTVTSGDPCCTKTMKDFFMLYSKDGCFIGSIGVFIRLSYFGKQVVTEFQMNVENKSVEFKANSGHYLFKYLEKGKSESLLAGNTKSPPIDAARSRSHNTFQEKKSCSCLQSHSSQLSTCHFVTPVSGQSVCPPPCCNPPPCCIPQPCCIRPPCCIPPPCGCLCKPPPPPPPFKLAFTEDENPKEGNYQEIETQMGDCGGIKVRLHDIQEMEEKTGCPSINSQDKAPPPCGGVCVTSPACKASGGNDDETANTPEMYVLRVGTRKETMSKKNNIDLEFCTPMPRSKPPPPITDTKQMQYDPADLKVTKGGVKKDDKKKKPKAKK